MKRIVLVLLVSACALWGSSAWLAPLQMGPRVAAQSKASSGPGSAAVTGSAAVPGGPDLLVQLGERFEILARRISPSVVAVDAVKPPGSQAAEKGPADKAKVLEESGSGVLVQLERRSGYQVVTNNHVVAQSRPDQITVQLADGRIFRPTRVLADPETDIALLVIESAEPLPVAALGDSDSAKVGHWVLAIGSPFGLNQTVTHGIISARERGQVSLGSTIRIKDFLQTDAAINPGSSGGPLVDMKGEVIGVNTAIASHNGSSSGVAFSIPINLVKRIGQQLLAHGAVPRGYLGMQLANSFDANDAVKLGLERLQGALVDRVYPNTPAAAAGLRPQDVILQVDNVAIRNDYQLINLISGLPARQRIRLQVWRERAVTTLEAEVGDWNKAQPRFRVE